MTKKILVIDDEELIVRSLTKLLERESFEVFVIKRGQDAVITAEEEDFDLIISDIRMPGMNGVETVKGIFAAIEARDAMRPAVVFITGYADVELAQEAKTLNPLAYMYKPFDISALLEIIKNKLT